MHTNQPMRATFVLVKRDGGWLVMHHHVTVIV
jgi:ketosteroid isomerase-like protein